MHMIHGGGCCRDSALSSQREEIGGPDGGNRLQRTERSSRMRTASQKWYVRWSPAARIPRAMYLRLGSKYSGNNCLCPCTTVCPLQRKMAGRRLLFLRLLLHEKLAQRIQTQLRSKSRRAPSQFRAALRCCGWIRR